MVRTLTTLPQESKDHSRQVLESMEDGTFENSVEPHKPLSNDEAPVKETNRVLGGYKATLKSESSRRTEKGVGSILIVIPQMSPPARRRRTTRARFLQTTVSTRRAEV